MPVTEAHATTMYRAYGFHMPCDELRTEWCLVSPSHGPSVQTTGDIFGDPFLSRPLKSTGIDPALAGRESPDDVTCWSSLIEPVAQHG